MGELHIRRQGRRDGQPAPVPDRSEYSSSVRWSAAHQSIWERRSARGKLSLLLSRCWCIRWLYFFRLACLLQPIGGVKAESNPGPHGFSQIVYQFSSDSANNGSAFDGFGITYGLNNNPNPAPESVPWDIAAGFVIMFGRFLPIIAPIAMAGFLGMKKSTPFGLGTLRDDTFTFGCLLFGTIVIVGALLFLPVATLGPVADHLGPIPFGG